MTTPDEPESPAIPLDMPRSPDEPSESMRVWHKLADESWPDCVPLIEMLHQGAWVDPRSWAGSVYPEAMRVIGFASRGSSERVTHLAVHCLDCIRAFEGALRALPKFVTEGGALTKALERDQLKKQVERLEERLLTIERVGVPLPADVRVLGERIDRVNNLCDGLNERLSTLETDQPNDVSEDLERLERNLDETDESLTNHKREVTRRMGRLESDIAKLENDLSALERGRRR